MKLLKFVGSLMWFFASIMAIGYLNPPHNISPEVWWIEPLTVISVINLMLSLLASTLNFVNYMEC